MVYSENKKKAQAFKLEPFVVAGIGFEPMAYVSQRIDSVYQNHCASHLRERVEIMRVGPKNSAEV